MPEWITRIPCEVLAIMLIAMIIFPISRSLLKACRRKWGWLTYVVVITYVIGILFPASLGVIIFGNAIGHFHYQVPDFELWALSIMGLVIMLGIITVGGGCIATAIKSNNPH